MICLRPISFCFFFILSFSIFSQSSYPLLSQGQYQAEIKLYGKRLTGILINKIDSSNGNNRVVMVNEMGLKYFDFFVNKDSFIIHQTINPLQKHNLIQLIVHDISAVIIEPKPSKRFYKDKGSNSFWRVNKKTIVKAKQESSQIPMVFSLKHIALPIRYRFEKMQNENP